MSAAIADRAFCAGIVFARPRCSTNIAVMSERRLWGEHSIANLELRSPQELEHSVVFLFLLVGLLFTVALAFAVGSLGGLRCILLLCRGRGALGCLLAARCLG